MVAVAKINTSFTKYACNVLKIYIDYSAEKCYNKEKSIYKEFCV